MTVWADLLKTNECLFYQTLSYLFWGDARNLNCAGMTQNTCFPSLYTIIVWICQSFQENLIYIKWNGLHGNHHNTFKFVLIIYKATRTISMLKHWKVNILDACSCIITSILSVFFFLFCFKAHHGIYVM